MGQYSAFYAREATLVKGNLYKVYAVGDTFHFARVADKPYDQVRNNGSIGASSAAGGIVGALISALIIEYLIVKPRMRKQQQMEARVEAVEPGSAEFMAIDKRNFSIRTGEILGANLSKAAWLTRAPGQVGVLELSLNSGQKRKFALTGGDTAEQIERTIRQVASGAQGSLA